MLLIVGNRGKTNKSKRRKRQSTHTAQTKQVQRMPIMPGQKSNKLTALFKLAPPITPILALIVATIALVAYLYVETPTPNVVFLDVKQITDNPLNHQFTLSNAGSGNAKNIHVQVKIDMMDESSRLEMKNVEFHEYSLIEDINIPPNQHVSFDINRAVPLNQGLLKIEGVDEIKPSEATATFTITYKGFMGKKYESKITYKTFLEEGRLVWKVVGPRHDKLFK
jgi:hypothetical protein